MTITPQANGLSETLFREICCVLEGYPEVNAAYVHGSVAMGTSRRESDLDLALLTFPGRSLSMDAQMELTGRISIAAGRVVDIGTLSTSNLIYARQVLSNRITLLEKDPAAAALFFMSVLGEYDDFKFGRAEVERAYAAR